MAVTANNQQYLGHDDWRLPNSTELESLVDLACSSPAINTDVFPDTASNLYWSSTTYAPDPGVELPPDVAWRVSFVSGVIVPGSESVDERVRLVRGGQSFDALAAYAIDITLEPTDGGTAECDPNPVPVGGSKQHLHGHARTRLRLSRLER